MASSLIIPAASIIIVLLAHFSSATAVAENPGIVTDADGDYLFNAGIGYYIVPSTPNALGISGALSWTPNNRSTCPLLIKSGDNSAGAVASISWIARAPWIPTSTFVTIRFHDSNTPCNELLWSLNKGKKVINDDDDDNTYVTAGFTRRRSLTFDRFGFQIKAADIMKNEFYIKWCHSYDKCDDVGFFENNLLGITPNNPVPFRFVKAFKQVYEA